MRVVDCLPPVLFLVVLAMEAECQVTIPRERHPLDDVPIATIMRRTVAFIGVKYREGSETKEIRATGFFVSMEEPRLGEGAGFIYLVTNRHVAAPKPKNPAATIELLEAIVRLNLRETNQGQSSRELNLLNEWKTNWFFPADDSVDLVLCPINN